jgi:hypothetical protein
MSSPAVPEQLVQVDRHTYAVTDVGEGGFGKVWLLKRRTEQWDYIYGPVNAVKNVQRVRGRTRSRHRA